MNNIKSKSENKKDKENLMLMESPIILTPKTESKKKYETFAPIRESENFEENNDIKNDVKYININEEKLQTEDLMQVNYPLDINFNNIDNNEKNEIIELKFKIKEMNNCIIEQEKILTQKEKELAKLRKLNNFSHDKKINEIEYNSNIISELNNQILKQKNIIEKKEEEYKKLQEENNKNIKLINILNNKIKDDEKESINISKNNNIEEELNQLKIENEKLKKELNTISFKKDNSEICSFIEEDILEEKKEKIIFENPEINIDNSNNINNDLNILNKLKDINLKIDKELQDEKEFNSELIEENTALKQNNEELINHINELRNELNLLEKNNDSFIEKEKLINEITDLSKALEESKNEIDRLNNIIFQKEEKKRLNNYKKLEIEENNLNIFIEKKCQNEVENLKEENFQLKSKINEINNDIINIINEKNNIEKDLEKSRKNETNLKEKIKEFEKEINNKKYINDILKSFDGNTKQLIETLEKKMINISKERDNYLHKFDDLLTEKERLEDDLKELEDKLEEQLDINNDLGNLIEKYKNNENNSKDNLNEINNSNLENKSNINPNNYEIISSKKLNNLNWYLLKLKCKENNNYSNFIWISEDKIDLNDYNYLDNSDEQMNNILMKKLKLLEEKEEIISKLKFENEKLRKTRSINLKKNSDLKDNENINLYISDNIRSSNINNEVPFEKYSQVVENFNDLDIKYNKLKIKYQNSIEKLKKYEDNVSSHNDESVVSKKNNEMNIFEKEKLKNKRKNSSKEKK